MPKRDNYKKLKAMISATCPEPEPPHNKHAGGRNAPGGPPHNKKALKHGLYAYQAMLNGNGLDERTSLFKALREKEQELVSALGGDPSPQEQAIIGGFSEEHALHCQPG